MPTLNTWIKRFRNLGQSKPRERVLTPEKIEVLTSTQACRFRQLQHMHFGRQKDAARTHAHYPLDDAGRRLGTSADQILASAAASELECYVLAADLRGRWRIGDRDALELRAERIEMPRYLALSTADCRDIQAYGSVNVFELDHPAASDRSISEFGERTRFQLAEPLWVDPGRIVLTHPLPVLDAAPVQSEAVQSLGKGHGASPPGRPA